MPGSTGGGAHQRGGKKKASTVLGGWGGAQVGSTFPAGAGLRQERNRSFCAGIILEAVLISPAISPMACASRNYWLPRQPCA